MIYSLLRNSVFQIYFLHVLSYPYLSKAVCEIKNAENVIILDIKESLGDQINQTTSPSELPILGDISQMDLSIQSATYDYFTLSGKKLLLHKPLDRDEDSLASIQLQVGCRDKLTFVTKSIPVLVRIVDINDNPPEFTSLSYTTRVSELAPVGTTVFRDLFAVDKDAGSNGLVEYFTVPGDGKVNDGYKYFTISLPYQGLVTVNKPLDYEKTNFYNLIIHARDKATNSGQHFSATTTLTIYVEDGDDLDPSFVYEGCALVDKVCVNVDYEADIMSGALVGVLKIKPDNIKAKDQDSLNAEIHYSFVNGTPSFYMEYFKIDHLSGAVIQIRTVDRSLAKQFTLIVKAEENTDIHRFTTARLTINVQSVDNNPPVISPSSTEGYVDENAPVGTTVITSRGGNVPLKLSVTDADIASDEPPIDYTFELTASAFRVNSNGYLIVNEAELDRDPPNPSKYTFQVIARQIGSTPGHGASSPVSLSVYLNDINDNSPRLPTFSPVRIKAGEGVRQVTKIQARDNDDGDFAKITYSIYHVSNNGQEKFRIESESGIVEVIGKVIAGEQYSITVQATDSGGRFTQSILDVIVIPGPNTRGPKFEKGTYEVQVSEGASVDSAVLPLLAEDPESDDVYYSIIEGNINGDFFVDSKSGIIKVRKSLDREEVSTYTLKIKAEDPSGLFSSAKVSITVTDINDQNPVFLKDQYLFSIDEGLPDVLVGVVQAKDEDIGLNGELSYSVSDNSDFEINPDSGKLFTKKSLDYEKQKSYYLVVTAKDKAPDTRISTVSVTVLINDIQDEVPIFKQLLYEVVAPENAANYEVVQVKATDPDTVSSITYVIKEGNSSLFAVDPVTGVVRTVYELDYEFQQEHTLVVGTLENTTPELQATCSIKVSVQDKNDIPPIFSVILLPIRLQDTVPLGSTVTTVVASDGDGTSPGNQVRYVISGQEKAPSYFFIDANSGVISVKDDLRKEPDSEYKIEVKAQDLGEPSLTATTTVIVYVEHIAAIPSNSGLGFADNHYTVEVEEMALANTLIKVFPLVNKPNGNFPVNCEIVSGNEKGNFYVVESENQDCELRIQDPKIDYEQQSKYLLSVHLNTVGGIFGLSQLTTQVTVNVIDLNDNHPEFIVPTRYSQFTEGRYLAALPYEASAGTQFVQIIAEDADSGSNGKVSYELVKESDPNKLFKIDKNTGFLSNTKTLEDISMEKLPLKVIVRATDSPDLRSAAMFKTNEVLINLISDSNRLVLAVKDSYPDKLLEMQDQLLRLLQEHTSLLAGLEKVVSLKNLINNTIEPDTSGSDMWFHLVEPGSFKLLQVQDPHIHSTLIEKNSQNIFLAKVSRLLNAQAETVRLPFIIQSPVLSTAATARPLTVAAADVSDLGAALIALAAIIIVLGLVGIIYHCFMWSRYVAYQERLKRLSVAPRYEPVLVEPSLKEYETQVLQMSVPTDEEGSFTELRGFDNISYITRDKGDGSGSGYGEPISEFDDSSHYIYSSSPGEGTSSIGHAPTMSAESNMSVNKSLLVDPSEVMIPTKNPLFQDYERFNLPKHLGSC
ncbi:cadherin 99C isoform X2 [Tachypleus tridentatus]|uniref:cadherin 99C isoform X2 n=1 Tax=Tachypleus tridentatus TaxID=6853 RepID=UPI003FCF82FB